MEPCPSVRRARLGGMGPRPSLRGALPATRMSAFAKAFRADSTDAVVLAAFAPRVWTSTTGGDNWALAHQRLLRAARQDSTYADTYYVLWLTSLQVGDTHPGSSLSGPGGRAGRHAGAAPRLRTQPAGGGATIGHRLHERRQRYVSATGPPGASRLSARREHRERLAPQPASGTSAALGTPASRWT